MPRVDDCPDADRLGGGLVWRRQRRQSGRRHLVVATRRQKMVQADGSRQRCAVAGQTLPVLEPRFVSRPQGPSDALLQGRPLAEQLVGNAYDLEGRWKDVGAAGKTW